MEGREVPATFLVSLRSPIVGTGGLTEATISGSLDLNAAYPSVPGGILVNAQSDTEAVRKGLFGRVGARLGGEAYFYDYGLASTSSNTADHKPFYVDLCYVSLSTHVVALEDMAKSATCDWDYNDRYWYVDAIDINPPPPPPPPGTVTNSLPWVPGPKLEILDKNAQGMTDVKVAKWQNAYETTDGKVTVKPNFVNSDDDRFFIRVTDPWFITHPQAVQKPVQITTNSDPGHALTLYPVYSEEANGYIGVFATKRCIVVSNDVDDQFAADGVADDALNDPTFKVKLGDTLIITYNGTPEAGTPSRDVVIKRVPVRVLKEAKVHITVMTKDEQGVGTNNTMNAYATEAQVNQWMNQAQEQYAQVGVRLVWTIQFVDQPKAVQEGDADVNLGNGLVGQGLLPPEFKGLLRGYIQEGDTFRLIRTQEDDVELYFINYFSNIADAEIGMRGLTFKEADAVLAGYFDMKDSSVVSVDKKYPFTIAHEIGHALTNAGHYEDPPSAPTPEQLQPNLMRNSTSSKDQLEPYQEVQNNPNNLWTTASKRLDNNQQQAIYAQRPAIVKDYIP